MQPMMMDEEDVVTSDDGDGLNNSKAIAYQLSVNVDEMFVVGHSHMAHVLDYLHKYVCK